MLGEPTGGWEETLPTGSFEDKPMTLQTEFSSVRVGSPPSPPAALRAWNRAIETFDTWRVAADFSDAERGWMGARVVVRVAGQVVGRGSAVRTDEQLSVVAAALAACLRDIERRSPFDRDEDLSAKLSELVRAGRVELEIAGGLAPLDDEAVEHPDTLLSPGLDGVAVRLGDRLDLIGSGELLATTRTPSQGYADLLSRLTGEPGLALEPVPKVAAERGAVFYRFRSAHLAQLGFERTPRFLQRGGDVVEAGTLDRRELEQFAEGLAAYIIDEIAGRANAAEAASQPDAWLAVVALAHVSSSLPEPVRGRAASAVGSWLELARLSPPRSEDALALASAVAYRSGQPAAWARRAMEQFAETPPDGASPREALRVWALTQAGAETGEHAGARLDALLAATPDGALVSLMPFAGWACLDIVGEDERSTAWLERLISERLLLWGHQLRPGSVDFESRDLVGGVVFTAGGARLPTWHTARPVAFAASALRDPRLTPEDERVGELSRVMSSLRVLRQLAVDAGSFSALQWGASGWGVRASLWDAEQPLAASALTLIAVSETLETVRSWGANRPAE